MTDELLRLHVERARAAQAELDESKCPFCGCHGATGRFVKRCADRDCGRIWPAGGS